MILQRYVIEKHVRIDTEFPIKRRLAADLLQLLRELDPLFRDSPPHTSLAR